MPSIEIACVDLSTDTKPLATSFAVTHELGLRSHRSPAPRFQADFAKLTGALYHIGNPEFAGHDGGPFFAYDVLSEASREADPKSFLEFDAPHVPSMRNFLQWLLDLSPCGRILFTSDWQFGPSETHRFEPIALAEFWSRHDSRRLLLNAAYPIARAG
jgi:hypothetical protein